VSDVQRFGQENLNQATRRYLAREAHGVIGWTSGDLGETVRRPDSKVLMTSDQFRVTMDVVVSGAKALETKREALQAFHDAWFEANKMVFEQPDRAAADMARWNSGWTGVGSSKDLRDALGEFAQATLADNQAVMTEQNISMLYERYKEAQIVWQSGGRELLHPVRDADLPTVFEPGFVRQSAAKSALTSTQPPVNPTFHLTARPEIKGLTPEQQKRLTTVAVLGVSQVRFPTGSSNLSEDARRDLEEQVIPVLRNTVGTYLRIEGSAGWATGKGLDESKVNALAFERARSVQAYLIKFGISVDRLVLGTVVPRCRECADADAQRDDRAGVSLATT
jgi:outer membrane protein OmpA-like peptidoglycan-associated protein